MPKSNYRVILKRNGEFIYPPPSTYLLRLRRVPPLVSVSLRFPALPAPRSRRAAGVQFFLPLYVAREPSNFPVAAVYSFVCSLLMSAATCDRARAARVWLAREPEINVRAPRLRVYRLRWAQRDRSP